MKILIILLFLTYGEGGRIATEIRTAEHLTTQAANNLSVDHFNSYKNTSNNISTLSSFHTISLEPKLGLLENSNITGHNSINVTFIGNATTGKDTTRTTNLWPTNGDEQHTTIIGNTNFNGTASGNTTTNGSTNLGVNIGLHPKQSNLEETSIITSTTIPHYSLGVNSTTEHITSAFTENLVCSVTIHSNGTNTTICRNDTTTNKISNNIIPKQLNGQTTRSAGLDKAASKLTVTKQLSISKNKLKLISNFSNGSSILGIGTIFDDTFVLQEGSPTIRVFDRDFEMKLTVANSKSLTSVDMVSIAFLENLFVIDASAVTSVLRIRADRRFDSMRWIFSEPNFFASAFSVTPDKYILVTDLTSAKLREFLPNGVLIKTTNLASSNIPLHAVKLEWNVYVASFGKTPQEPHQVCLFDGEGKQIGTCYGGDAGSNDGQLNAPIRLMVTDQSTILVADSGNARIVELDSKLGYVKTLLGAEDGLRRPTRIVLDRWRSLLLVGDNELVNDVVKEGKVLAYKI